MGKDKDDVPKISEHLIRIGNNVNYCPNCGSSDTTTTVGNSPNTYYIRCRGCNITTNTVVLQYLEKLNHN